MDQRRAAICAIPTESPGTQEARLEARKPRDAWSKQYMYTTGAQRGAGSGPAAPAIGPTIYHGSSGA